MLNLPKSIPAKYAARIAEYDDERDIGNSIIVTLKHGYRFGDDRTEVQHVEGFDNVKAVIAAMRGTEACGCADCAHRVSLEKQAAPECVAVLHDVPQERNADVMARAVDVVRDRRLTAEYLDAKEGFADDHDGGIACDERVRALAAEQSRADRARVLVPESQPYAPTFPAMSPEIDTENGDDGSDDDDEHMFLNHYDCPECGARWTDEWSAQCDDDCPDCGARHISPFKSEDA